MLIAVDVDSAGFSLATDALQSPAVIFIGVSRAVPPSQVSTPLRTLLFSLRPQLQGTSQVLSVKKCAENVKYGSVLFLAPFLMLMNYIPLF